MISKIFKSVVIISLVFVLVGCGDVKQKEKTVIDDDSEKVVEPVIEEEKAVPVDLGLFVNRELVSSYDSSFPQYQDMVSFEVYLTKDNNLISGNQKSIWNRYYDNYKDVSNLKIGFEIKFDTDNGEVDKIILNPSDVDSFFEYVQIYLYDDIHQVGSWYSHVTDSDVTDDTIFTSIKLTGSTKIAEIKSPITLIVFAYQSDKKREPSDNNSYQVTINRK